MSVTKQTLRTQLLSQRKALTPSQRAQGTQQLNQALSNNLHCSNAQHIGFYHAYHHELSPQLFLQTCLELKKHCYFPICCGRSLRFGLQSHDTLWQNNPQGIPEPMTTEAVSADQLDCLLVPCLGCDAHNNRLGYGKGFYDICLSESTQRPWLIGLIYDVQICPTLQTDPWDIPMDEVCIIAT